MALAEIVAGCPAHIVLAGGPKQKTTRVVFGRNIYGADDPAALAGSPLEDYSRALGFLGGYTGELWRQAASRQGDPV
jgi:hypothetical protein